MKKLLLVTTFLVALLLSTKVNAQENTLLQKLVEKNVLTQQEADELKAEAPENSKNLIDKGAESVRSIFSNTPYLQVGGYGLLTYRYREYAQSHNNFQTRVIILSAKGELTKNLSYYILFDLKDPMLYEYYIDWRPMTEIGLRAGQMKVPFTLENPISLTKIETVFNTRSISALAGMGDDVQALNNGVNKTGRDIGVQLSGSLFKLSNHSLIHYAAGIFQGEGMNVSEKDNHKDFAGTLLLEPIKGLRLGGGLYAGQATYSKINSTEAKSHVRNRWAISAEYISNDIELRSEWIKGNDGGINKEGLYGMATWNFCPGRMNVVGKVDYYNKNKDLNAEVMDYTVGLNYYFYKQCRLMLDYTYSAYSNKWGGSHRGENAVTGQIQIVF